jgi:hypothetical protein
MNTCVKWAEESYEECAQYEDQGYNSCADWDSKCCGWWPCSWACKIVTWFCVAWFWVSNIVCVLWTTITTLVCVLWVVVGVILVPVTFLVELVFAIPILGRLIKDLWNVVTEIFWRLVGLFDALLTLIGVRLLKKMRLCIIVLRDEAGNPTATAAGLQPAIDAARRIYRDAANIELIVEGPHTVGDASPGYALDVECGVAAWGEEFWLPGTYFQATAAWHCALGGLGRITGYGAPIVVFCVRQIPGSTAGCALGPATDYLTIEGGSPGCLAHEIGHKVGLWHCCPTTNLANEGCGGAELNWWQVVIVRNSKYVTYV